MDGIWNQSSPRAGPRYLLIVNLIEHKNFNGFTHFSGFNSAWEFHHFSVKRYEHKELYKNKCRVHSPCFACVLLTKRRLQKCSTPIRTGTLENTFFSICFKGKKSLHSRMLTFMAGYGSHKSGLLFNMKHSRQLNFYCLQHLLLGKRNKMCTNVTCAGSPWPVAWFTFSMKTIRAKTA